MSLGRFATVPFAVGTPDPQTRSVWLTQLVLAATVAITNVLALALRPDLFARWYFGLGTLLVMVVTLLTLALPWSALPRRWILAVPFADIVAIGLISAGTDLHLAYLWVFPVMWVGMHFGLVALALALGLSGAIMLIDAAVHPTSTSVALRVFIVLLSLTFLGITAHLALRRSRALRRLLRRQAGRLTQTLQRSTEHERLITEIVNGVDTGIVRFSSSGRLLTVNDAYIRMYGLDPTDPAQPARSVEYDDYRGLPVPVSQRPFDRAARGQTFTEQQVWLFTPDGEWRALSVSAKRLRGATHDEVDILLTVDDVTDRTFAAREREQLNAMASHELRHPLTVILGNAELALEVDELTPRTRDRLETIAAAGERMREMTKTMLSTSRERFGDREDFRLLDLRTVLQDSITSFLPTAELLEIELDADIDAELPLTGDGFRLRQVIDNVVSNAVKYTPPSGRVRISATRDDGWVAITVADTGIGIDSADLPRVLSPYFRAEAARDRASGTGLGLAVTNEIIKIHRGSLNLESEPGEGTTVTIRLPSDAESRDARDAHRFEEEGRHR